MRRAIRSVRSNAAADLPELAASALEGDFSAVCAPHRRTHNNTQQATHYTTNNANNITHNTQHSTHKIQQTNAHNTLHTKGAPVGRTERLVIILNGGVEGSETEERLLTHVKLTVLLQTDRGVRYTHTHTHIQQLDQLSDTQLHRTNTSHATTTYYTHMTYTDLH